MKKETEGMPEKDRVENQTAQGEVDKLRELDAKLDAVAAVMEELAVNQQLLAQQLASSTGKPPALNTRNAGLYVVSNGTAASLTTFFQSRGTFTLFQKCCQHTCKITIG